MLDDEAEDLAAAAAVEALLDRVADHDLARGPLDGVVWFCACITMADCPVWVITDNAERTGFCWTRLPDDGVVSDIADTSGSTYGAHVEPTALLAWLRHGGEVGTVTGRSGDLAILARLQTMCARTR